MLLLSKQGSNFSPTKILTHLGDSVHQFAWYDYFQPQLFCCFNHLVLQYTLRTHQFHCCLAAPKLTPSAAPFPAISPTRTKLQCSDLGQCICTGTVFWENREDWSNSSPSGGVPEICFWEALRSQEFSLSKSKLEHHKSVLSSWTLGSARRQNAGFF